MAQRLVGVTDEASGAGVVDIRARERTVIEQCVIPERCREAAGQHPESTSTVPGGQSAWRRPLLPQQEL
jgi:hypothetical protein